VFKDFIVRGCSGFIPDSFENHLSGALKGCLKQAAFYFLTRQGLAAKKAYAPEFQHNKFSRKLTLHLKFPLSFALT